MGVLFQTDSRRIIPRWRSFELSLAAGELTPIGSNKNLSPISATIASIQEQLDSWRINKSIVHACDLFSSAYVLGLEAEVADALEFIVKNQDKVSPKLYRLASSILAGDKGRISDSSFDFSIDEINEKTKSNIRIIRSYLKEEPKNSIVWAELARN